ncbi:hypothetical protein [Amycolatopsis sp. NBC_00438]|uniref:hypothetical protein n=1 Tax=Amycolatopsis sp. NBC_00438 TaxID=2903558 RepID=UPI002E1A7E03
MPAAIWTGNALEAGSEVADHDLMIAAQNPDAKGLAEVVELAQCRDKAPGSLLGCETVEITKRPNRTVLNAPEHGHNITDALDVRRQVGSLRRKVSSTYIVHISQNVSVAQDEIFIHWILNNVVYMNYHAMARFNLHLGEFEEQKDCTFEMIALTCPDKS